MAEITENNSKGGKKRARKQSTRIDMTPMVDLAFLLLTFFVLTSTFTKPKAIELALPADTGEPSKIKRGLTFLLTKDNRVFYYKGEFILPGDAEGRKPTELTETNFSKVHNLLLGENKLAIARKKEITKEGAAKGLSDSTIAKQVNEMMARPEVVTVLVKTDAEATYQNAVDMLDELKICDVGKRVLGVEMMEKEYELLQEKIK